MFRWHEELMHRVTLRILSVDRWSAGDKAVRRQDDPRQRRVRRRHYEFALRIVIIHDLFMINGQLGGQWLIALGHFRTRSKEGGDIKVKYLRRNAGGER